LLVCLSPPPPSHRQPQTTGRPSQGPCWAMPPVVGMTSGVCKGQRCLPAGVPGVSTALGKEDRLCASSRLTTPPRRAGARRRR
jgi:hypothetical protein